MYKISKSPSRYEDLVNIFPKTRYVHTESPSGHVKARMFLSGGRRESRFSDTPNYLLARKVVYRFTTRPSHIYTCFNRFDVAYDVFNGSIYPRVTKSLSDRWTAPRGKDLTGSLPKTLPRPHGIPRHLPGSPPRARPQGNPTFHSRMDKTVTT